MFKLDFPIRQIKTLHFKRNFLSTELQFRIIIIIIII
jgi:hypothetical protein